MNILYWLEAEEFFYINVFLKLLLGLVSLIFVINISGKGNLAPSSAVDQIQNYVLGGIIGGVIYSPSVTLFEFFIILVIWTFLILGLRRLKTKNHAFKMMIDGEPLIIINRGKLDVEACRKAGLTASDVAFKLRKEGVYRVKEVKRAVLEQNGEFIIVLAGEENPKYPIITDGTIQRDVLEDIDKTEEWLLESLHDLGYESVTQVFLGEYANGVIYVVPYIGAEPEEK